MLAEHGILGGISLLLMLIMTVRNYFKKQPAIIRGIRGSMIVWSLLTLTHSAMRLSCAPFMFGIGFVTIDFDD
jgi:O-antigen ligase